MKHYYKPSLLVLESPKCIVQTQTGVQQTEIASENCGDTEFDDTRGIRALTLKPDTAYWNSDYITSNYSVVIQGSANDLYVGTQPPTGPSSGFQTDYVLTVASPPVITATYGETTPVDYVFIANSDVGISLDQQNGYVITNIVDSDGAANFIDITKQDVGVYIRGNTRLYTGVTITRKTDEKIATGNPGTCDL